MVAAGAEHTVVVSENGKLYGWGWGRYGDLGLADRNDRFIPEELAAINGEKFSMIACGWRHTITVSDSGNLYTYGWIKYGQLGHDDYEDHLVPCRVEGLSNSRIAHILGVGDIQWLLIEKVKYMACWNKFGQVSVGDNIDHYSPFPMALPVVQTVMQVSCGWRHTVAVTNKHNVFS